MYELFVTHADGTTRNIALDANTVTLGRGPSCELSFPDDPGLSRRHMCFELDGSNWIARDLGSTNGTLFNGEPLAGFRTMALGDRVTASQVCMEFRKALPPEAPKTVVFDTAKTEVYQEGTVSISLDELLASTGAPKSGETRRQWVTPLQALIRVGRQLAVRRPLNELFHVILELSLEAASADRGVLFVLENEELVLRAFRGADFRISTTIRDRVMLERDSILIKSIAEMPDLSNRKSIVIHGVQSLMAVPLQTDEKVIGLLYLDSQNYLRRFTEDDLNLLTVMANVAAIRIERERLAIIEQAQRVHEAELQQAAEIQLRNLPSAPPVWPGLEIAALHVPCRTVGGDYHGYFRFADGRYGFLVGDVAGKGMPAALMMMSLHARVHALAEANTSVAELVTKLNRSMQPTCSPNRFVTMFVGAFDPATGVLTYTSAGHNPTVLVRLNGAVEELSEGGMFVGLLPNLTYTEHTVVLNRGDTVILYTDGITEQENSNGEEYGLERLTALAIERRTKALTIFVDEALRAVTRWAEGEHASDDQTVVAVRRA